MKPSFFFYANPYQPKSIEAAQSFRDELEKRGAAVYAEEWLAGQGVGQSAAISALLDLTLLPSLLSLFDRFLIGRRT